MAEGRRYGLGAQLEIEQILLEAQNRWLRPPEICEILRNYRKFRIAPEPPNRPPSGSLFLFDRKVLRYFRKDGHNWRKKKDGKTVKEAHERLKAGSVDVLHCYYAHGEENENFQRRSYWMLEEDLMHIVLVHYREVKGNKANYSRTRDSEEASRSAHTSSPVSSSYLIDHNQVPSRTMDTSSLNSAHTSEFDDAESDNHQVSSRYHSFLDLQQPEDKPLMNNQMNTGLLNPYIPVSYQNDQSDYQGKQLNISGLNFGLGQENVATEVDDSSFGLTFSALRKQNGIASWEESLEHSGTQFQSGPFPLHVSSTQTASIMGIPESDDMMAGQFRAIDHSIKQEMVASPQGQVRWQTAFGNTSADISTWSIDELTTGQHEQKDHHFVDLDNEADTFSSDSDQANTSFMLKEFQFDHSSAEVGSILPTDLDAENDQLTDENLSYSSSTKHPLLDNSATGEGIKKFDSFSRWMSKEFEEVDGPHVQSNSSIYWNPDDSGDVVDDSSGISPHEDLDPIMLSPSLSQDQLFSILDFSPNWAYTGTETKVLITGRFLKDKNDAMNCKWSCMFGEVEVTAEVLADGVLRCKAPAHAAGRVPFYVTCSNRVACSEVREFEYRASHLSCMENQDASDEDTNETLIRVRFGKLLSLDSVHPNPCSSSVGEKSHIINKISSLLKDNDDEWSQMEKLTVNEDFSSSKIKEKLFQKILKEKLHAWLLQKVAEDGKGPNVLDKEGQGVLHFAAALGYDWAIAPTLAAGVNINFRDVRGWTALHWAAFYGRENMVIALVSLDANCGALTDPTPEFPSGRTPADLASSNGHKGIAGYLAEESLTRHLKTLTIENSDGNISEIQGVSAVQTIAERSATDLYDGDVDGLSLKHSLSAVRNAAQAAARIHEVFRVQSFHRKQLIEYGDDKFGMSGERAITLVSVKSNRSGPHDEPTHTAAIRIQNKFRGWKGRKEFLIIRQRIVKIQAHVRGHQVRKQFRKIVWSVGIVEKAILRWRRKGSGLRGFRSEGLIEGSSAMQTVSSREDDYDFLKEGRKQTEARLQTALARVRSMARYPEARDQYQRLLHGVTEFQETKVVLENLLNGSDEAMEGDDMIALEALLGDDTFMSTMS